MTLLVLNAGSSSVKFACFDAAGAHASLRGQVDGLTGAAAPRLTVARAGGEKSVAALEPGRGAGGLGHAGALAAILPLIEGDVGAVGHRVVHGGARFARPVEVTPGVLEALAELAPLAPLHQPHNLAGLAAAREAFPNARQIACFDTAFHWGHPRVEDLYALPRRYYEAGVRRYGFHGLSYEYVSGALEREYPAEARGRVIIAHLGSGASMCALNAGRSVGSSMGFSALEGLPMGTRPGSLDPGVLLWMLTTEGLTAQQIETLLYKESGLKGLSGVSGDLREIEAAGTPDAEEAIAYFVSRCRREIGGLAALLEGLDSVVFTGGIGENARRVRAAICEGLTWLGLTLDPGRNAAGGPRISAENSRVSALVIRTDEEAMIARHAAALLQAG